MIAIVIVSPTLLIVKAGEPYIYPATRAATIVISRKVNLRLIGDICSLRNIIKFKKVCQIKIIRYLIYVILIPMLDYLYL